MDAYDHPGLAGSPHAVRPASATDGLALEAVHGYLGRFVAWPSDARSCGCEHATVTGGPDA